MSVHIDRSYERLSIEKMCPKTDKRVCANPLCNVAIEPINHGRWRRIHVMKMTPKKAGYREAKNETSTKAESKTADTKQK